MTCEVRTTCGGCGEDALRQFLDLGTSPLANTPGHKERYPLRVAVCTTCWLVQLLDVVADDLIFDDSYTFYSRTSPSLVQYHAEVARSVLWQYRDQARRLVVEIGSNDGSLLQHFVAAGMRVLGVDPAGGPARDAMDNGVNTLIASFTLDIARKIRDDRGPAGLIFAKNVAAHVADIQDLFAGIAHLLADDGVALIEVQYLADMLVANQIDQVYHEHRYFYSLTSIRAIARRHGLDVSDVELTAPQGGSIRVALKHAVNGGVNDTPIVSRLLASEAWLRQLGAYKNLQARADYVAERLIRLLNHELAIGRVVAGYGMPAKATTLLNFCGVDSSLVSYITDMTPAKQNTQLPGTDICVIDPTNPFFDADTYLVLAWNYLPEIIRREHEFIAKGGRLIVPLPTPMLI